MMSDEDRYIRNYLNQNIHIESHHLEVPYNQYGSRGFVDAVFSWEPSDDDEPTFYEIVEVKSEAAISEATGANEIIRQVNKMAAYFIEGQETDVVDTENHIFRLDIIDTEYNRQHLLDNYELYQSIHDGAGVIPGINVVLVSQEGEKKTTLGNLKEWTDEPTEFPLDPRSTQGPSPIGILDERKEPEGATFCHRHGGEMNCFKPMVKMGGDRYVIKTGRLLFYCPKCILEIASRGGNPFEIIGGSGGFEEFLIWWIVGEASETKNPSDTLPGADAWEKVGDVSEAEEYAQEDVKRTKERSPTWSGMFVPMPTDGGGEN